MAIGFKIKRLREIKGLTQEQMSEKLGMSIAGYGKLERDESELSITRLEQIAKALELKVEDITSFDEKMVFNNYGNGGSGYYITNNISDNERKLYEDKIRLLEEQNLLLKSIIEKNKSGQ